MTDVASGAYQQYNPFWAIQGRTVSTSVVNQPVRSNIEVLGYGGLVTAIKPGASEKALLAAVPVTWGDEITTISVVTAAEAESGSEFIGAIYSGVANTEKTKVLAESAVVKEQFKKEKANSTKLKSTLLITPANAPFGFVYAGLFTKETTITHTVSGWKITAALLETSATAKTVLGAWLSLTEASTGSFASAKNEFEVASGAASVEVPWVALT